MAEKVKVSLEVAEALDDLLLLNTNNDVMKIYFDAINVSEARQIPKSALIIKNLEPMQLAVILLNGYEIEQTPEEILLMRYEQNTENRIKAIQKKWSYREGYTLGYMLGVQEGLNFTGTKIKGIND